MHLTALAVALRADEAVLAGHPDERNPLICNMSSTGLDHWETVMSKRLVSLPSKLSKTTDATFETERAIGNDFDVETGLAVRIIPGLNRSSCAYHRPRLEHVTLRE